MTPESPTPNPRRRFGIRADTATTPGPTSPPRRRNTIRDPRDRFTPWRGVMATASMVSPIAHRCERAVTRYWGERRGRCPRNAMPGGRDGEFERAGGYGADALAVSRQ